MADSTVTDINKMKVVELRKELKSRGLPYSGDKSELINRLNTAMSQDDHGDITLDSDEIDSDGVLEDEDDKSQTDILDESAVDTLNEELALSDPQPLLPSITPVEAKPHKLLKRKIVDKNDESKAKDNNDPPKKIVLNRNISTTLTSEKSNSEITKITAPDNSVSENEVLKNSTQQDVKSKMEMRAKRFGLPLKATEAERKEARKERFGQNSTVLSSNNLTPTLSENLEKLKKRADRFGESVSKIMTDIEKKEKLEKRKEKFGGIK